MAQTKYYNGTAWVPLVDKIDDYSVTVKGEVPSGLVNGTNTVFTVTRDIQLMVGPGTHSASVYKNGVRMKQGTDYNITVGKQIQFVTAPASGSVLLVDYDTTNSYAINGSLTNLIKQNVTGTKNGTNKVFQTSTPYAGGSLQVYINGVYEGNMVEETSPLLGTFTLTNAPLATDNLQVSFQTVISASGNADTVDGIHASSTPTANTLLPLNSSAQVPVAAMPVTPSAKVYRATDAAIANGAWTSVPFVSEAHDTHDMHDNTTNNTRITIQPNQGGTYLLNGQVNFAANGTGGRGIKFVVNGLVSSNDPNDGGGTFDITQGTYEWRRNISTVRRLVPGDYVELFVFQGSGGSLTANAQAAEYQLGTFLAVTKIGA